jgi:bifunctional non-homologous end joining protein LigD
MPQDSLSTYRAKRDFSKTAEPKGADRQAETGNAYLIQKHAATRLHYDFRLQIGDALASWAVTKGPSLDPRERRLAVHVEDHPLEYGGFEGIIPKGEYGGGTVMLWDRGTWEPRGDAKKDLAKGQLKLTLHGERLKGNFVLVRMKPRSPRDKDNWLLIKEHDQYERPAEEGAVTDQFMTSVTTGRSMEEIAAERDRVHRSNRVAEQKPGRPRLASARAKKAAALHPEKLAGARKGALPKELKPQLATLTDKAPAGANWQHEIKLDGYRALAFIDKGKARIVTRNGNDWTARVPALARALARLPVKSALLDGEIVVIGGDGVTHFGALQQAFAEKSDAGMTYYLFDLLHLDGWNVLKSPLAERRALLQMLMQSAEAGGPLRYSDHLTDDGPTFFQHSCRFGLEGIISKRADAPYKPGRGTDWLKTKCIEHEEFVIGGFVEPTTGEHGVGAVLVGYYDTPAARGASARLVYAGKVGTGFTQAQSKALRKQLDRLKAKETPFAALPRPVAREAKHVRPELVAEIEFSAWTEDGILRHASFKGVREDKQAVEVTRADQPKAARTAAKPAGKVPAKEESGENIVAGIKITHPDRVLHKAQNVTKLGLAQYYAEIADWVMPHMARRPLSLYRCPGGNGKQGCFFQKHIKSGVGPQVKQVEIAESNGAALYPYVEDIGGLVALVQYGVVEFHPWGGRIDEIERADQMIFDFDPDPSLPWPAVIEAALEMRRRLKKLGLTSFVKTTGGKGLHVVAPLNPRQPWDAVKSFAKEMAEQLSRDQPDRYLAVMTKAKRVGKIFVDYLRNGRGATAICAYSTRARDGAPIAIPLFWDELTPDIKPDHFTIETSLRRLHKLSSDPWKDFFTLKQTLPKQARKKR